jgi:GT2 family glycosyltransferase
MVGEMVELHLGGKEKAENRSNFRISAFIFCMNLSVIICTHNPRPDYLRRMLDALKAQTLPKEQWELLLIDNASQEPLAKHWDLSWHPHARHIREEELGLTPARLRGIAEAQGGVLVFVDDDNVLDKNYLAMAVDIGERFPPLGAWGGRVVLSFETEPPEWAKPHIGLLAERNVTEDRWSNSRHTEDHVPYGSGMCIRREVAVAYRTIVQSDPVRMGLDRRGDSLVSGGDVDMAITSFDLGFGTGLFAALEVTHLIPATRLQENYLLRLKESIEYSAVKLAAFRGHHPAIALKSPWRRRLGQLRRRLAMPRRERLFMEAKLEGQQKALREILKG